MASANDAAADNLGGSKADKSYLENPRRIELIKQSRDFQRLNNSIYGISNAIHVNIPFTGGVKKPSKLADCVPTPIKLGEMDPTVDKIFDGRILRLIIIEDPVLGFASLHLLAEDEDGAVTSLYIYNVPQDAENCDKFGYGQQLDINNPYMRIARDLSHGIRVDNPESISILGKKKDMCRYCGNENAPMKCSGCEKAHYCSRECQLKDWKILGHKMLCKQ